MQHLSKVDLYRYDDAWELDAGSALQSYFDLVSASPKAGATIVDLRQPADYAAFHLPGSVNVPFVQPETPSPFADPRVLDELWTRLEKALQDGSGPDDAGSMRGLLSPARRTLLLCYDGDSARVATSVLRAKGFEAESIRAGARAWAGHHAQGGAAPSNNPVAIISTMQMQERRRREMASGSGAAPSEPIVVAPQAV